MTTKTISLQPGYKSGDRILVSFGDFAGMIGAYDHNSERFGYGWFALDEIEGLTLIRYIFIEHFDE